MKLAFSTLLVPVLLALGSYACTHAETSEQEEEEGDIDDESEPDPSLDWGLSQANPDWDKAAASATEGEHFASSATLPAPKAKSAGKPDKAPPAVPARCAKAANIVSSNAVGDPCATTEAVMEALRLTKRQRGRVAAAMQP